MCRIGVLTDFCITRILTTLWQNEKDQIVERQDLFIDVQFNGVKRQVQILDRQPDETRYEQVIPLPATRANNIL